MRKRLKYIGKGLIFLCILCVCIEFVYQIIVPKFFYDNAWPTTSTYTGFYEMEENTVDVIFLGSSHAVSNFIPQELYNNYGITSYNLGCEEQNLLTSYFWLKEALQYQQPQVVVLDCYLLFEYNKTEPLNSSEACTRKAFDYMKWSSVKAEAVKTICKLDENQSLLSYYFPNIRYHTRWRGLEENDFVFLDKYRQDKLKGYTQKATYCGLEDYVPFEAGSSKEETPMLPLMKEYLDKIAELCRQEDISLILTKTPTTSENAAKYYTIQKYADERGLLFLDFNEKTLYEKIDFCFQTDNCDSGHGNLWGAKKITNYIGKILVNQYGIEKKVDKQWEDTKSYYEQIQKDCGLKHITDIDEYLAALQDDRYSVFISAKDDCTSHLKASTIQRLRDLGLQADLQEKYRCSYLAVISDGEMEEQISYEQIAYGGSVRNGFVTYEVESAGYQCGNFSSITIEGAEQSKNGRGLNIVVYNNDTKQIMDSVCFDTFAEENTAIR